jgi:beta-1,2-mannobiose phosphorylase / 1,2-beta-oligomannan phosphorylase
MLKVRREGIILRPTPNSFENKSVFNPATYQVGQTVHMIYRAIDENYISRLGYAKLKGPLEIVERWDKPFMQPRYKYECKGIEDPRLTKIDDTYYLVYIAHDGKNCLLAYAYGDDIFNLKRGGIISPKISYKKAAQYLRSTQVKDDYYFFESYYRNYAGQDVLVWDKDGIMFPQKIGNKFALMHRILPDIQVAYATKMADFQKKEYWVEYLKNLSSYVMLEPKFGFENRHIGGCAVPILTRAGWLIIYHGTDESNDGRVYRAAVALADKNDPQNIIARLPYPLFSPEKDYETDGHVNNVVFPTGTSIFNRRLYMYYGTADTYIAVSSVSIDTLLKELLKYKDKN